MWIMLLFGGKDVVWLTLCGVPNINSNTARDESESEFRTPLGVDGSTRRLNLYLGTFFFSHG